MFNKFKKINVSNNQLLLHIWQEEDTEEASTQKHFLLSWK